MLTPFSRPNFFPGQLLDFRDFNRLAEQADRASQALSSRLFLGGGILLQALREFEIVSQADLTVVIKPGVAILPNGEMAILAEDRALDLSTYLGSNVRVALRHQSIAQDPYTDLEDPSIQGFRTQSRVCEIVVSGAECPEDSLELFRVDLRSGVKAVRAATLEETWIAGPIPNSGAQAVLDMRHRKSLVPLSFAPLAFAELIGMRKALYSMEEAHRRIQKIFLLEDKHGTGIFLSQLHAEILCVPYQPLKVAFLVSEFAEKLALFMEAVSRKCANDQPNFHKALYLELSGLLEVARVRHALPRSLPFTALQTLSQKLEAFALFAEQRFTLMNAVEEALLDLRDRAVDFASETTFAGHLFHRVDSISALDKNKVEYLSPASQVRKLQTRYRGGDNITRTGVFVREGKIALDFEVPNPDSPVVIWFPQYVRRQGATLEYGINGKTLLVESSAEPDSDNFWKNRGLIVQPEALVPQGNRLTIRVDDADLDYGFFEAAVYQPTSATAGGIQ